MQTTISPHKKQNKLVPLSMAIGNGELMQECFPKHLRMGTTRMKYDKETDEEGKKRSVSMESRAKTKKFVPTADHYLSLV